MDWQGLYDEIVARRKSSHDFEPAELFEMASQLAVADNLWGKKRILEEWILAHPGATDDDKIRGITSMVDWLRRMGEPKLALSWLSVVPEPDSPVAKAEYYHTKAQCLFKLPDLEGTLEVLRQIIGLFETGQIPVDKQLWYLEGLIGVKLWAVELDQELEQSFDRYHQLFMESSSQLEKAMELRCEEAFVRLRGRFYRLKGDFSRAAENFLQNFHLVSLPIRNRLDAALEYLYCTFKMGKVPDAEVVEFFKTSQHHFQPTDIAVLKEEYDFVSQQLARKP